MPDQDLLELKRRLQAEGFEIYRTKEGHVSLAERVRDNLILDSGIAASSAPGGSAYSLRLVLRAQTSHFPGYPDDAVLVQARTLAEPFLKQGYTEETTRRSDMTDPSDPSHVLDTVHEVVLRRDPADWTELVAQIRAAFTLPRASTDD